MISLIKCFYILVFCSVLFSMPAKVFCLEALSKDKMKTTTGQRALTDFSINNNTARMYINTHIETYTEIQSMKLGHYDRPDLDQSSGWDQNWTNLKFGNSTDDPLKMDGFIIKADFDDNHNLESDNPRLKRLIIGTNKLNGTISGNFESFTGAYNPALTDNEDDDSTNGKIYIRDNLGSMTDENDQGKAFNFDSSSSNQGFFLILSPKIANTANNSGIHAVMGYNENSITNDFSAGEWWDAP